MTLYIDVCYCTSTREYAKDVNEIYSILFPVCVVATALKAASIGVACLNVAGIFTSSLLVLIA
jgi:hypothetical protein